MSCDSNCSCAPCSQLRGLGLLPPTNTGPGPYELNQNQISDLFGRNVELGTIVTNAEVYGYPDLHQGYSFTDSVYGNVVISLDASDHLRVIAQSPVNPGTINQPPYVSPGLPSSDCDWLCQIQKVLSGAEMLVLVLAGIWVYGQLKRP